MTMNSPAAPSRQTPAVARWRAALDQLAWRHRVHASRDMSACYRELAAMYPIAQVLSVNSGERSGSWVAPPAWEVDSAQLIAPDGSVVADYTRHPLSLFVYSPPFEGHVSRAELESHLFSIPNAPERIPFYFRNQYRHWDPLWGFCLPHHVREQLPDGEYRVSIKTRLEPGQMEAVEQVHPGEHADSILLVGHFDHPWMTLDGLIGCLAGHEAIARLAGRKTRLTWRMLSVVEIIGSVFYAERWAKPHNVKEALFVATAGADAPLCYQESARGNSVVDRAMRHILGHVAPGCEVAPFRRGRLGNDETAFDVAGVNIPCGSVMRAPFPQYHTDADNAAAVHDDRFEEMVDVVSRAINVIERNSVLHGRFRGLPCLSAPELDLYLQGGMMSQTRESLNEASRRFFDALSPAARAETLRDFSRVTWMMNLIAPLADGVTTTLDLAEKVGLPFEAVDIYTDLWVEKGLLEKRWVHPFR